MIALAWGRFVHPCPCDGSANRGITVRSSWAWHSLRCQRDFVGDNRSRPLTLVGSPTTATAQPPPDSPSIHVTGKLLELRQREFPFRKVGGARVRYAASSDSKDIVVIPRVALYVHMAGAEIVVVDVRDPNRTSPNGLYLYFSP